MEDYISKSELIEAIKQQKDDNDMHCRLCMDAMIEIADELPTVDEKEIIRKTVERIVERLEEEQSRWKYDLNVPISRTINKAIEICKEVGGIE